MSRRAAAHGCASAPSRRSCRSRWPTGCAPTAIELTVDRDAFAARRRAKTEAELAGIRRAQHAAEAGMAPRPSCCARAEPVGGRLRARRRGPDRRGGPRGAACGLRRARAHRRRPTSWSSVLSGRRPRPGSGPLPAALPITIDLWPRDEATGCWADMTRTFVVGEASDEVLALHELVLEALAAARSAVRPGHHRPRAVRRRRRGHRGRPAIRTQRTRARRRRPARASTSPSATASASRSTRRRRSGSPSARHRSSRATSWRSNRASRASRARRRARSRTSCWSPRTAARPSPTTRTRSRRNGVLAGTSV